ncbi:MAG: hypothetical protein CL860_03490 [Cyanobium sp. MED195]|nr:hypothetical protein [Cyanobium sp. MED195]
MLATLTGDLCLLAGLAVLLLPLLATELSRPRDGAWGAVVLLLGLVLVTSSDRLRGAPILGVACAGLLISRLGAEVGQARWQQLSDEERQRLGSRERWTTSLQQLTTVLASLVSATADTLKSLKPAAKTGTNKLWVRPEQPSTGADLDNPPSGEAFEQVENSQDSENDQTSEPSNDKDAAAETPGIKKPRKKFWIRPDSSEPSLETQEVSSTPSGDESQSKTGVKPNNDVNETDDLKAETSTNNFEEGSADNAIETASNSAANTTENTARTDED